MKRFNPKKALAMATQVGVMTVTLSRYALAEVPTSLNDGVQAAKPTGASDNLFSNGGLFQSIANTLIFIVGAVSVIMLIVGGLRYVLSSGNASAVEGAKNTILFAIIGVVVAALSFAIVSFVVSKLGAA
jgi:hypothetical protein